jgi:hypothetical protein
MHDILLIPGLKETKDSDAHAETVSFAALAPVAGGSCREVKHGGIM